jgi:heptosyltransferase-2
MTLLAIAPNWLGDVVMALPAMADLRRHAVQQRFVVAARPSVAPLFELVPGVDDVVTLSGGVSAWAAIASDAQRIREVGASTAVLFPNSIRSAITVLRARIPIRWGYRRDFRSLLLTRGVPRARGPRHQVDAYRHLVAALGFDNGPREPRVDVPAQVVEDACAVLRSRGWDGVRPLVGIAPGAAFGGAKRWPGDRVARLIARVVGERGATCVLVGGAADVPTTHAIAGDAGRIDVSARGDSVIDLAGQTTLVQLAGILAASAVFVSNDSGAMHLAAAVGTPVVAVFGPTNERATAPVPRVDGSVTVIVGTAWCRPCGLRECPIDHRCMTSVSVDQVVHAMGDCRPSWPARTGTMSRRVIDGA